MGIKVNRKEAEYGQPRCCNCGRFIRYSDFFGRHPKALIHYTPDTDFSSEEVYWEHVKCKAGEKE